MKKTLILVIVLLITLVSIAYCNEEITYADFSKPANYDFNPGAEYPGTIATLNWDKAGYKSTGALKIDYNFTDKSLYCQAIFNCVLTEKDTGFSFMAKGEEGAIISVRICDKNYEIYQTSFSVNDNNWKKYTIYLNDIEKLDHWSGDKNNKIDFPTRAIYIGPGKSVVTKGSLYIDNIATVSKNIKSSKPVKSWFPEPVTHDYYKYVIGYNEPGESENDARDLRVTDKDYNFISALLGRVVLYGTNGYSTPSVIPIYSFTKGDSDVWQWQNIDNRVGFIQKNQAIITKAGVTMSISVKFTKDFIGDMEIPFIVPKGEPKLYSIENNSPTPKQITEQNKANAVKYTLNGKDVCFSFSTTNNNNFTFEQKGEDWQSLLRRVANRDALIIKGNFKAGYENTYIINIDLNGDIVFPKITTPKFDEVLHIQIADKDEKNNWIIPYVPKTLTFFESETKELAVNMYNLTNTKEEGTITFKVRNYDNKIVSSGAYKKTLDPKANAFIKHDLNNLSYGLYSAEIILKTKTSESRIVRRFSVLHNPVKIDNEKSFFGLQAVFFTDEKEYIQLLDRMGVHFLRIGNGGTWWPNDRKECLNTYDKNNIGYFFTFGNEKEFDLVSPEYAGENLKYYEVFNEPDAYIPMKEYPNYVIKASKKIKGIFPNAKILAPGVSGGDTNSGFPYVKNLVNSDAVNYFDVISVHPYSDIRIIGPGMEAISPENNALYEKLRSVADIANKYNKELWIGEVGFSTKDIVRFPEAEFGNYEKEYANFLARYFLIARSVPEIKKIIWFHMCPEKLGLRISHTADNNGPYNILGAENNPIPIFNAYTTLAASIDGSELVEKLNFEDNRLNGIVEKKDNKYFVALWSSAYKYDFTIPYSAKYMFRTIDGRDVKPINNKGFINIKISEEPIYILSDDSKIINTIKKAKITKQKEEKAAVTKVDVSKLNIDWHAKKITKPLKIDGDLSDWNNYLPIILQKQENVAPPDPGRWKGKEDLSAKLGAMYDDKNLYIAVEVTDDVNKNNQEAPGFWKEDSLQIGIGNIGFPYNYMEMNVGASTVSKPIAYVMTGSNSNKELKGSTVAVKRVDNKTIYEVCLPLASLEGINLGKGQYARLALIINDSDNTDQRKWMGVKNPIYIGMSKEAENMPVIKFE